MLYVFDQDKQSKKSCVIMGNWVLMTHNILEDVNVYIERRAFSILMLTLMQTSCIQATSQYTYNVYA